MPLRKIETIVITGKNLLYLCGRKVSLPEPKLLESKPDEDIRANKQIPGINSYFIHNDCMVNQAN